MRAILTALVIMLQLFSPRLFSIAYNQFRVLLIGKDGTLKLSRARAVTVPELFTLIDSMPMRQMEMQTGGGAASDQD